ncbi:unnamed protein product [Chrysoparadoxa australica]
MDFVGDDEARLRYQRQRLFQTGLLLCFMLLLLDSRGTETRRKGPEPADKGDASIWNGSDETGVIGKGALDELMRQLGDYPKDLTFPPNATGYYEGAWSKVPQAELKMAIPSLLPDTPHSTGAVGTASAPGSATAESGGVFAVNDVGYLSFTVAAAQSLGGLQDVNQARGYMSVADGPRGSMRSSRFNLHGVFLPRFGRLTAVVSTTSVPDAMVWSGVEISEDGADVVTLQDSQEEEVDKGGGRMLFSSDGSPQRLDPADEAVSGEMPVGKQDEQEQMMQQVLAALEEEAEADGGDIGSRLMKRLRDVMGVGKRGSSPLDEAEIDAHRKLPTIGGNGGRLPGDDVPTPELLGSPVAVWPITAKLQSDQAAIVLPTVPAAIPRRITQNGRGCFFLLNLQVGPIGTEEEPLKNRWVEVMAGEISGINCNFSAHVSTRAIRLNLEEAYPKAVNYSVIMTLISVLQIGFLFKQLQHSQTQAAAAKVSLLTVGNHAIIDALLCVAHLLMCAMLQPLFVAFASIALLKLATFCIFEMRYIVLIFQARQPQSFFEGGWTAVRREMAALHGRFYAALLMVILFAWFMSGWFTVLVPLLYSFWVPQIISNVARETRHSLHRTYLLGLSATRLIAPLYIYGCNQNFLQLLTSRRSTNYTLCLTLVAWVGAQVLVLLAQDKYGPHFFIPKRFLPPKYDYHRPIPATALRERHRGTGALHLASSLNSTHSLPSYYMLTLAPLPTRQTSESGGSGGDAGEEERLVGVDRDGNREPARDMESGDLPECTICYNNVDVANDEYLICPCDHIFHPECLERWSQIKMECPTCRAQLPPL